MTDPDLQAWVGRRRVTDETLTLDRARGLAASLDRDPGALLEGAPLPDGWHWVYFHEHARRSELSEDGHERRGDFLPPVPLERRMWAGGRVTTRGALVLGARARRTSTILTVEEKEGRSGPLVFVTVGHEIEDAHGNSVAEEQDLVYLPRREPGQAERPSAGAPPPEAEWHTSFLADEVTLFRFSALTFNGHRIHYDHRYATEQEGYPGLVVHGPLVALLLFDFGARCLDVGPGSRSGPRLRFDYRALGPLFCGERFDLGGRAGASGSSSPVPGLELWASHPDRGVTTRATLAQAAPHEASPD